MVDCASLFPICVLSHHNCAILLSNCAEPAVTLPPLCQWPLHTKAHRVDGGVLRHLAREIRVFKRCSKALEPGVMTERAVAILFDTVGTWSLSAIEGIADYIRRHARWRLLCAPTDQNGRIGIPQGWQGDGILTRLLTIEDRDRCLSYGVPVVDLEAIVEGKYFRRLARVRTNNEVRATLLVEHLRGLNLKHFACFNPPHHEYSQARFLATQAKFKEYRCSCNLFWKGTAQAWHRLNWKRQQEHIKNWISSLPSGTGVVAPDGRQGRLLCECCHFLDVRIPDDLVVITCDDDGLLNSISTPPISGVVLASRQHGYAAAELLDRMMDGEPAPKQPVSIDPLHIVTRQSTDILTLPNPDIVRAIRYIRENASEGIRVSDVANQLSVSRRWLEKQFLEVVGHTIGYEIRKARFERAKAQLEGTDLSVEQIAAMCGFSTGARLCRSFRQHFGETPLEYRRRSRP